MLLCQVVVLYKRSSAVVFSLQLVFVRSRSVRHIIGTPFAFMRTSRFMGVKRKHMEMRLSHCIM